MKRKLILMSGIAMFAMLAGCSATSKIKKAENKTTINTNINQKIIDAKNNSNINLGVEKSMINTGYRDTNINKDW